MRSDLLIEAPHVDHVPVRGHSPIPHLVHVDSVEFDRLPGRPQSQKLRGVNTLQGPADGDVVRIDDHVVQDLPRLERRADHGDSVLEPGAAGALAGQRHVVLIVLGGECVQQVKITLANDLAKEPQDRGSVSL